MDLLWSCKDLDQVRAFIQALPTAADRCDARSLVDIATWDSIEEELGLTAYENEANTVIDRARQQRL